ncbi:MAG: DUF1565 domain-containing protein [Trueperaceae bacterium]|nr:DUF1565 domain-containing protein [Trueperaceae bacterium]
MGLDNVRLTGTASLPTGFLLNLSGPPTFVNLLYVDSAAAPGGDGSINAPFQTITEGVAAAPPGGGGIIIVAAGTYTESVIIDKPLTLRGPNENIDPATGTRGSEARLSARSRFRRHVDG